MAEKSQVDSIREWLVENKLKAVGCLWLSSVSGSLAYNWTRPNMKTSVKIIHARIVDYEGLREKLQWDQYSVSSNRTGFLWLHAQALTLASLVGAGIVEYYDHKSGAKANRYARFIHPDAPHHKD